MADSASELPQDLINEVLLLLPARSVGRSRCVSKLWRSHLTSSKFVKSHRNFHITGAGAGAGGVTSIIVPVSSTADDVPPHLLIINSDGKSRKVTSPFFVGQSIEVHAACHGFVLVELDHAIIVFNPLTLEALEVPESKLYYEKSGEFDRTWRFGLGYDSSSDDYSIFKLLTYRGDSPRREYDGKYVEVYSLKKKSWSRVMNIPYKHHDTLNNHVSFVNGRLHWKAWGWGSKGGYLIAAYNLAREEFEEISPPYKEFRRIGGSLTDFGGCFAVVSSFDDRIIWVMKEYGAQESWNKIEINTEEEFEGEFVCLLGVDELVFRQFVTPDLGISNLVVYSLSTGVWREWDVPINFKDGRVLPFTECLLSPKH